MLSGARVEKPSEMEDEKTMKVSCVTVLVYVVHSLKHMRDNV